MVIEPSRIAAYAARYGLEFGDRLGVGANGEVQSTNRTSAVKFFYRWQDAAYRRERIAYTLFRDLNLISVAGHAIPRLIRTDDELLTVEMTIVTPPYLLDFASAYLLDEVPDFPDDVWEQYRADLVEKFGTHWPRASVVIDAFESATGLILLDPHLSNLKFACPLGSRYGSS
jgi:hypothetical protein